jgi:ribonuclease D
VNAAALALSEEELPRYPRTERRERDPAADQRLAILKLWRTSIAKELELEPGILINNGLLEEIARNPPRTLAELELINMKRWQRRVLGAGIVAALQG